MSTLASQTPGRTDADFEDQTYSKVTNSVGNLAGFVSRYMVGWIKDSTGSTNIALYVIAGLLVMAGAIVLALPRDMTHR